MRLPKSLLMILTLTLFSLGGCSRVTLGYNYADWLLRYRIADYTSFTAAQKDEIHLEVDGYMRWHRKYALPEYTAFLQRLDKTVGRDHAVTAEDVSRAKADLWQQYRLTVSPMIPPAARILDTLDSRQIAGLESRLAEQDREYREENLRGSEQEILAKRADRHIGITESLVGSLSAEQEAQIRKMNLHIPVSTAYIDQREAKHAALISMLNGKASEAEIAALFRQWMSAPEISRTPQQQQAIAAYEGAMNEMTAQIFALLTPRQKQHLSKKLLSYIADFQQLHLAAAPLPD